MPARAIKGILETALYTADLERSTGFYRRLFNFPMMFSNERMAALDIGPRQVLLLFLKGGSAHPMQSAGGVIPPHDGNGQLHLAFSINKEDLDNWTTWLQQLDIDIESVVHWPAGGTSVYFRDPDAHLLELATPGLWKNYL